MQNSEKILSRRSSPGSLSPNISPRKFTASRISAATHSSRCRPASISPAISARSTARRRQSRCLCRVMPTPSTRCGRGIFSMARFLNRFNPVPRRAETLRKEHFLRHGPGTSNLRGRSNLFKTVRHGLLRASSMTCPSSSCQSRDASRMARTRSAFAMLSRVRRIPSFSTRPPPTLKPAVSKTLTVSPAQVVRPSTRSLVVPGIGVTIAFSSPSRELSRVDFPTFGRPAKTTNSPSCRRRLPSNVSDSCLPDSIALWISSRICCLQTSSTSSSLKSSPTSRRDKDLIRRDFSCLTRFESRPRVCP